MSVLIVFLSLPSRRGMVLGTAKVINHNQSDTLTWQQQQAQEKQSDASRSKLRPPAGLTTRAPCSTRHPVLTGANLDRHLLWLWTGLPLLILHQQAHLIGAGPYGPHGPQDNCTFCQKKDMFGKSMLYTKISERCSEDKSLKLAFLHLNLETRFQAFW